MSLQELVQNRPQKGTLCGIARIREALANKPDELTSLDILLTERLANVTRTDYNYVWSQQTLAEALTKEGFAVSSRVIAKHRRQECSCPSKTI